MDALCHVTTAAALAAAGARITADPFLHCCTESQLPFVLARHFAGQAGLIVLRFDPAVVEGDIVWEQTEPGMDPFPHLYGTLPVAAVSAIVETDTPAGRPARGGDGSSAL